MENDTVRGIFCKWRPQVKTSQSWVWGALWQKSLPSSHPWAPPHLLPRTWGLPRAGPCLAFGRGDSSKMHNDPQHLLSCGCLEQPGPPGHLGKDKPPGQAQQRTGCDVRNGWQQFHSTQPFASSRWKSACSDHLPKCVLTSSMENQDKWLGWNNRRGTYKGESLCWVWISCLKHSAETTLSHFINQHAVVPHSRWVKPSKTQPGVNTLIFSMWLQIPVVIL